MIKQIHHHACRCRDSEETRKFYEDFLGLPLACTLEVIESKTARPVNALHTFYAIGDGSYLAFFDVPGMPFEFKTQHDFDLHIALEVEDASLHYMLEKARKENIAARGVSEHGMIRSVYFEDPNGYVVELTARTATHDAAMNPKKNGARAVLDRWQSGKPHA